MKTKTVFNLFSMFAILMVTVSVLPVSAAPAGTSAASSIEGPAPEFFKNAAFDVSPALSDLAAASAERAVPQSGAVIDVPRNRLPTLEDNGFSGDGAIQEDSQESAFAANAAKIPALSRSFEGLSNLDNLVFGLFPVPPDPVGDVGKNHYVQMVNQVVAVYSRTGTRLMAPLTLGALWTGFPIDDCTDNSGDPIVVYDQFADRWILTQFTTRGPVYYNCVMVSVSGDPTGAYYRYAFEGLFFPDYPKYGVWRDSYLITSIEFDGPPGPFVGLGVYALERNKMLRGRPNVRAVRFLLDPFDPNISPFVGSPLLPPDIDGNRLPGASAAAPLIGTQDDNNGAAFDALNIWDLFVKWDDKPKASLEFAAQLPVTKFDSVFPCAPDFMDCIPQPGVTADQYLDITSDRPMWRLAYRNFGDYEALVTNQSVEARSGIAGVRWYEVRRKNGSYSIQQQGTYAPEGRINRWLGSIAMDKKGNIALGYSVSNGTNVFPGIRYTGRLKGDQLGRMTLGEGVIINGSGVQTDPSSRWGDYSSMNIDPRDDCTFWYVNQYYTADGQAFDPRAWQTRIASFKLPGCSGDD